MINAPAYLFRRLSDTTRSARTTKGLWNYSYLNGVHFVETTAFGGLFKPAVPK